MDKEVRIVMVGGRPFPNYQGILTHMEKISKIAFIYTPEGVRNFENLFSALSKLQNQQLLDPDAIKINAYNIADTLRALRSFREKYFHNTLSIDVTSAPKIPSFGAVSFLVEDSNSRIIYVDSRNGLLHEFAVKDGNIMEINKGHLTSPNIFEFLKTYGREAKLNFDLEETGLSESQATEIVNFLVSLKQKGVMFLDVIRSEAMKSDNEFSTSRVITFEAKMYGKILRKLADFGVVKDVRIVGGKAFVNIPEEKFSFLNGKWLDFYVAKVAEKTGLFKDVAFSLEIPSSSGASNEIDFIGILQKYSTGAVVIAECKTGKVSNVFNSHELDKLHSVSEMIGGNFVMELFITNRYRNQVKRMLLESFINRAKVRNIEVILGDDLPNLLSKFEELITKFRPL